MLAIRFHVFLFFVLFAFFADDQCEQSKHTSISAKYLHMLFLGLNSKSKLGYAHKWHHHSINWLASWLGAVFMYVMPRMLDLSRRCAKHQRTHALTQDERDTNCELAWYLALRSCEAEVLNYHLARFDVFFWKERKSKNRLSYDHGWNWSFHSSGW